MRDRKLPGGGGQRLRRGETRLPLFSVVVLNWNGRGLLEGCLSSLGAQTLRDFEVIVVDNGSTDGSVQWLEERENPDVRVLTLSSNRGFAGGNNEGIRVARGSWVILLNNDTAVDPGWLAALARAIERHPEAGLFTPKILNYERRDEIDSTGHLLYPDGVARGHHRLEKDDGRFDEEREAFYPSGCAGVYRKEVFETVGLLDEFFFAYCEDVDLGLRARWAGWGCFYIPDAVVFHKYSATAGAYSPQKAFLVERNRIWTLLKNFPLREVLLSPGWTALRYALSLRAALQGRGAAGHLARQVPVARIALTVVEAAVSSLAGLPRVLRQRRVVRTARRISTGQFREVLERFRLSVAEAAFKE